MAFPKFIESLAYRLTEPLPGYQAHKEVAPLPHRLLEPWADDHSQASVLILLIESDGDVYFPLIQRQTHPSDPHTGQIGLPGGKMEISDPNPAFTALRETYEEIGVQSEMVKIVGSLSPLYIPVSKFVVNPFIGWCTKIPNFKLQESEVKSLYKCPLQHLQNPQLFSQRDLQTSYAKSIKVAGFALDDAWVWGATAMILSEFREVLSHLET
ncbi:MAG: CoA pyrophosphatase [Saprospiraceae bacterium]|nr:CoA pyrophosphatase [Saprospiraceae bacterium]